ncbi:MAG TPA: hypothetical protein VIV15_04280, partial [Anaerolineales bacterium]
MRSNSVPFLRKAGYRLMLAITTLTMLVGSQAPFVTVVQASPLPVRAAAPEAAPTNHLTLSVVSATDSAPITQFKYLINIDNTGTTTQRSPADGCSPGSPGYPDSCKWVSVAGAASNSPVFTQGNESDFGSGIDLPPGRYLISILADGYKIDGAHFTMP